MDELHLGPNDHLHGRLRGAHHTHDAGLFDGGFADFDVVLHRHSQARGAVVQIRDVFGATKARQDGCGGGGKIAVFAELHRGLVRGVLLATRGAQV